MPVTLPPGRARLSTGLPRQDRTHTRHNDGNRLGRILGRLDPPVPSRYHDNINLETHQLGRKLRGPIELPLRISVFDGDVLSFDVAKLAQSQSNCLGTVASLAGSDPTIDTLSERLSSAAAPGPSPLAHRKRDDDLQ